MRSRLTALRAAIDTARASHSEVILRRAAGRITDVLKLSEQIRAVLQRVPVENAPARAVAREVHDLLARLHGAGSQLHRDVTEVGRQHLQLTGGLTSEQIVRALMRRSREELAAVGRAALLPIARPPPLLTTDVVASAAEQQVVRDRAAPEAIDWSEPPEAPRASGEEGVPAEVTALQGPHRGLDDAGVDLQERRSGVDELLAWVEDVPLVRQLAEHVEVACLGTLR